MFGISGLSNMDIQPSIFYDYFIQFRVALGLEPIPAAIRQGDRIHPGQVASLLQGQQRDKQTRAHPLL